MGIYQRSLTTFNESVVLNNGYFKHGCVNCHAFCGNRTEKMLIGMINLSGTFVREVEGIACREPGGSQPASNSRGCATTSPFP